MSSAQDNVLIVDDQAALRRTLQMALTASGFDVEEARNGEEALQSAQRRAFDLVLLDMNMPGAGGVDTCDRMRRAHPSAGIIMITVRDLEDDKIRALEAGADDYITKPFKLGELIARMRAVLRRIGAGPVAERTVIEAGMLKIDLERRLLWRDGREVHLSPREFELFAVLVKNSGRPMTHTKLLRSVWGPEYGGELEYLRSYVRMLRRKIEVDPARPEYILTEPWVGYRFHNPTAAAAC